MIRSLLVILAFATLTCLPTPSIAQAPADLTKWDADIAAFAARDTTAPVAGDALLFVGSSSIRMWNLAASWPGEKLINNGFGGSTLSDAIHHFDRLVAVHHPRAVVLYSGDNDISQGRSVEQVTNDFMTFVARTQQVHPGVPVVIIAIKPSVSRWQLWPAMREVNAALRAHCAATPGLYFADVATPMLDPDGTKPAATWFKSDGLHLSEAGYAAWTRIVSETLREAGVMQKSQR